MTPEQDIRAAALQAAATMTAPQLVDVDGTDEMWAAIVADFRTLVEHYADYIQHGVWPVPKESG